MKKYDEIAKPSSCLNKARVDERMFIMLARDPASPIAIRAWVDARIRLGKNAAGDDQIVEALACAALMEQERDA